jgi:hypothetical protein
MLFRLGGLFILCVFGASALRNVWPFSVLTSGAGTVATLTIYVLLCFLAVRSYRRRIAQRVGPRAISFPPWPIQGSSHGIVFATLLLLVIALGLAAYLTHPGPVSMRFGIAALSITGGMVLIFSFYGVRFGYFPSTPKGRGVSRDEDPPQFWVTFASFALLGATLLFFGVVYFLALMR